MKFDLLIRNLNVTMWKGSTRTNGSPEQQNACNLRDTVGKK
jgi:hypothetical protein